jgi:hypothetical protein
MLGGTTNAPGTDLLSGTTLLRTLTLPIIRLSTAPAYVTFLETPTGLFINFLVSAGVFLKNSVPTIRLSGTGTF